MAVGNDATRTVPAVRPARRLRSASAAYLIPGVEFDAIVHCTGSGGTQAGLLAGLAALGSRTRVIGVSDDDETESKAPRVLRLANATLELLRLPQRVAPADVEVLVADPSPYGVADRGTVRAIDLLARTEGLIADPVYEGKAVRRLVERIRCGRLPAGRHVLLLHMGGTPAVHGYADQLRRRALTPTRTMLDAESAVPLRGFELGLTGLQAD